MNEIASRPTLKNSHFDLAMKYSIFLMLLKSTNVNTIILDFFPLCLSNT